MPKTTEIEMKVASGNARAAKGQPTPAATRQFLAFVQTVGTDEQGRHVSPNGMKWKVA